MQGKINIFFYHLMYTHWAKNEIVWKASFAWKTSFPQTFASVTVV